MHFFPEDFGAVHNKSAYCTCLPPCNHVNYDAVVSSAPLSDLTSKLLAIGSQDKSVLSRYESAMLLQDWSLLLNVNRTFTITMFSLSEKLNYLIENQRNGEKYSETFVPVFYNSFKSLTLNYNNHTTILGSVNQTLWHWKHASDEISKIYTTSYYYRAMLEDISRVDDVNIRMAHDLLTQNYSNYLTPMLDGIVLNIQKTLQAAKTLEVIRQSLVSQVSTNSSSHDAALQTLATLPTAIMSMQTGEALCLIIKQGFKDLQHQIIQDPSVWLAYTPWSTKLDASFYK